LSITRIDDGKVETSLCTVTLTEGGGGGILSDAEWSSNGRTWVTIPLTHIIRIQFQQSAVS
jgi:hypothetical protein